MISDITMANHHTALLNLMILVFSTFPKVRVMARPNAIRRKHMGVTAYLIYPQTTSTWHLALNVNISP